ncbi:MAG TPA: MIP family channel protein [Gaiellaceae bacterium]|jgi:aquaporin Z|nr:MIP family channel protein [Gaiellaceae bacterium]
MALFPPLPPFTDLARRSAAEFVGTFALVFVGAGAVLSAGPEAGAGNLEIALAHGLVIGVMVSAVGHISGGHFNPAITLGMLLTRRISVVLGVVYWLVQLGGAALAALLLKWIFPADTEAALGAPARGGGIDVGPALVVEAVLTFFLVWVVFATLVDPRGTYTAIAGLAVGFVIAFDMLMGGPLTGAAMNPARAFGPELVANTWDDFWIWYIGPLAGGAIAALLYDEIYLRRVGPVPVGPPETGVEEPGAGMAAAEVRVGEVTPPPPPPPPSS